MSLLPDTDVMSTEQNAEHYYEALGASEDAENAVRMADDQKGRVETFPDPMKLPEFTAAWEVCTAATSAQILVG